MVNIMDKETYVRAVLECNFAGFKDEIIETALRKILEYDNGLRSDGMNITEEANKACENCQEWDCYECKYKYWRER